MADEPEDVNRARAYGLRVTSPAMIAAGNFGVDDALFHHAEKVSPRSIVYPRKISTNNNYFGFLEAASSLMGTTEANFYGLGLKPLAGEAYERFSNLRSPRVHLTDVLSRSDTAKVIREAEVVVSPSTDDGMPNSVLEALSAGAKVVAGRLPQLERLAELGYPVVLVNALDSHDIRRGIELALASPAPVQKELPQEYSRTANTFRVAAFYQSILGAA